MRYIKRFADKVREVGWWNAIKRGWVFLWLSIFRRLPYVVRRLFLGWAATRSLAPRTCPICGYHGNFEPFGSPARIDARCSNCGSLERHRLLWLAFKANRLFDQENKSLRVLHVAAEKILEEKFRNMFPGYRTADLYSPSDLQLDIEDMAVGDGEFDVVIANHVLEHVDDGKAGREISPVLAADGRFIAMVPIVEGWDNTYENEEVVTGDDRALHYGFHDHVRFYGRDFRDRMGGLGLRLLDECTAEGEQVIRFGLSRGEKVFVFGKGRTQDG